MKESPGIVGQTARFPGITKQMRIQIANAGLRAAKANYYQKYDISYEQLMKDYVTIAERQAEIKGENAKDVRRELARQACVSLAEAATMPMSPPPPTGWGAWIVAALVVVAAIVAAPFTGGLSLGLLAFAGVKLAVATGISIGVGVAVGLAVSGAIIGAVGTIATDGTVYDNTRSTNLQLMGHHELNQWNYKETVETTFNWETLNCKKCIKFTQCKKTEYPWFGRPYCDKWGEESEETCTDTQF